MTGDNPFSGEATILTHILSEPSRELEIAGVRFKLVAANGETYDHLYVWLPDKGVLFCGDNFYKSWPNLYPIRGASYRDILSWVDSLESMIAEEASFLVAGHTRPISGQQAVATVLTDYRDAIRFVFEKTVEGINRGMTPDQLVVFVQLPAEWQEKEHLRPYYGDPAWAIRSIFCAHLDWFDGNPTNLFPLSPREEAIRMATLAGGEDALLAQAKAALAQQDSKWAAQLCDHLLALNPYAIEPKHIKADALEEIAQHVLSGIGRNYYLTFAQELRQAARGDS